MQGEVCRRQFVEANDDWGSPVVAQWELAASASSIPHEENDLEFAEGGKILRQHLVIERHIGLRKRVLRHREPHGLRCECCGRAEPHFDIELQGAMFEVHHKRPLSEGSRSTTVHDVNLLCATCHRIIHRVMRREGKGVTADDLGKRLGLRAF